MCKSRMISLASSSPAASDLHFPRRAFLLLARKVSPTLKGASMRDVVGAAENGDRTVNAIPGIDRIPFCERNIGFQSRRYRSNQFRALHYFGGCAAKTAENDKGPKACRGREIAVGTPAAGNKQVLGGPAIDRSNLPACFIGRNGAYVVAKKSSGTAISR